MTASLAGTNVKPTAGDPRRARAPEIVSTALIRDRTACPSLSNLAGRDLCRVFGGGLGSGVLTAVKVSVGEWEQRRGNQGRVQSATYIFGRAGTGRD